MPWFGTAGGTFWWMLPLVGLVFMGRGGEDRRGCGSGGRALELSRPDARLLRLVRWTRQ